MKKFLFIEIARESKGETMKKKHLRQIFLGILISAGIILSLYSQPAAQYLFKIDKTPNLTAVLLQHPEITIIKELDTCFLGITDGEGLSTLEVVGDSPGILDRVTGSPSRYFLVYLLDFNRLNQLKPYGTVWPVEGNNVLFKSGDVRLPIEYLPNDLYCGFEELGKPVKIQPNPLYGAYQYSPDVPCAANPQISQMAAAVSKQRLQNYVQTLQDFPNRHAITDNCVQAGTFLYNTLSQTGIQVSYDNFNFEGYSSRNIVGYKPGTTDPSWVVILCAHYDTTDGNSPGADDDASGCAAVLEAARVMSQYSFYYSIKFILFSAEEMGLYGSKHYASEASQQGENIIGVINMDMISYTDHLPENLDVKANWNPHSMWLVEVLDSAAQYYSSIDAFFSSGCSCPSDHVSFWDKGFPAVMCSSDDNPNINPNYHTEFDTIDTINLDFLTEASKTCLAAAAELTLLPASPPGITVDSPNGGESWMGGEAKTIKWTTTGYVGNVKIEYSTDNGSNWSTVTSSTPNFGFYHWKVPDISSSQCLVKIKEAADENPADTSNAVFTIYYIPDTITITAPNGGEIWAAGSSQMIKWKTTGTVGNVKIEYSTDNDSNWSTITSSTANDGKYSWRVPDTPSSQCLVRIKEAADEDPGDTSNAEFTIYTTPDTITITAPNGGENWAAGSSQAIKWTTTGTVGNVKIEYSTDNGSNWSTITSSTDNDGDYSWVVPDTPSSYCLVKIEEAADENPGDTCDAVFTIYTSAPPVISLNRSHLNFGANIAGTTTSAQEVIINNTGGGTLSWTAASDTSWLGISSNSGNGPGLITITINPDGLTVGTFNGIITVNDPAASNSPRTIPVTLKIYSNESTTIPFGELSTPASGSTVSGSIPVTGWALDDIEVKKVEIFNGSDYVGDAVFVEGARPDVEQVYPGCPLDYRAGWGYMLLTNFLPNHGNGTFTLNAIATDAEGNQVTLGAKTITCDNAHAVKPFGAIDTPTQGGIATGKDFVNWGWVLTPQPNNIPTDGSTIDVWIDGVNTGHPTYNIYRSDIASLFPNYANSNGAAGYFYLDTTKYVDGVHTIQWTAADNAGNIDGIGSRYFKIQNNETGSAPAAARSLLGIGRHTGQIPGRSRHKENFGELLPVKSNISQYTIQELALMPEEKGVNELIIKELDRVEIKLGENPGEILGYLLCSDELKKLPIGSTLDTKTATFYWSPGPGFLGRYSLVFVLTNPDGQSYKKLIVIDIVPRFNVDE